MIDLIKSFSESKTITPNLNIYFKYISILVFSLSCFMGFSQQNITGTIVDEEGVPLPGVNVIVKGTNVGDSSDFDGNYSIDASSSDTLIFSFIGFLDQEIIVGNNTNLNITLESGLDELEEVVVTGYGSVKKRDLTGAIGQIKSEVINRANPIEAAQALQGQVAGVEINRLSSRPGEGFRINIRGLNSFEPTYKGGFSQEQDRFGRDLPAKSQPLVVVNGVIGANLNEINPSDIETIDVLKDASSTAVYGARGANGVIIVTTKKGSSGKPVFSYNGYYGIKGKGKMPEQMDAQTYYNMYNDPKFKRGFTEQEKYNVENGISTDWVDLVTQNGIQQNHTFSVTGGSESTQYSFSASKLEEEGMIRHSVFDRLSLNASIESQVSDRVKVGFTSYVTLSEQNYGSPESARAAMRARPTGTVYFDDIVFPNKLDTNIGPVNGYAFFNGVNNNSVMNPMVEINPENAMQLAKANSMLVSAFVDFEISKGLNFRTQYSGYTRNNRTGSYKGQYTKEQKGSKNAKGQTENYKTQNYTIDNTLTYNGVFGDHAINATALLSVFDQYNEYMQIVVQDLPYRSLWHNLGTGATPIQNNTDLVESGILSYMGRVNYTFMDKYLFTFTGRYDGASQLSETNRWAFFPSAAVGWRLSEESFIQDLGVFNNLKLRASYGEVGNTDAISPYATQSNIYQTFYDFDGSPAYGYTINSLSNQGLVWERSKELNIGIDFSLSDIKLSGTVEYYKRNTVDLILDDKVPPSTGFSDVVNNVGEIENSGIEVALNSVNLSTNDFQWQTNLTFTSNNDKVIKLAGGITEDKGNRRFVGESVRAHFSYKFDGIWQLGEEADAAVYGQVPGQIKVRDLNGDNKITADDRMILGKETPDWTAGLRNQFTYKNWDMSLFVYTRQGAMFSNAYLTGTMGDISSEKQNHSSEMDIWSEDNPSNTYYSHMTGPGLGHKNEAKGGNSRVALSYQLFDFVRISDITLGYNLPSQVLSELGVSRFRIYGQVQNPFLFTDVITPDPEYNKAGADDGFPSETFLIGVNLNF
jgi:TonB-linked SusC/RagA family outer membrane protein